MRGISEERLHQIIDSFLVNDMLFDDLRSLLISECKELNPCEENTLSLSVSDARELLNYLPSGTYFHAKLIKFIDASELQEEPKCER